MSSQLVQLQPVLIKVDGTNLPDMWFRQLEAVEVDLTLGAPDMVALHFFDPALDLANDAIFAHGKEVIVSAVVDNRPVVMATVEVASLEPDFRADGTAKYVVRGYGKWNRLQNGRKCKTYQQMKDSDIASQIAQAAGLSAQVTATSIQYDYVVQWQQTDMEFLLERAERIGFEVYQDGQTLVFAPCPDSGSVALTLTYSETLIRFQPRLSITGQINKVRVIGWDSKTKAIVAGEATPSGVQGGMGQTGAAAATAALSRTVQENVTDGSVASAADATGIAAAIASRVNGEFFEAEGECVAAPSLRPGMIVKIANVGTRFSGDYRVTGVNQFWSQDGLITRFTVLGRTGASLANALYAPPPRRRIDSLMVGVVSNLNDPDQYGRVRVKFPTLGTATAGEEIESFWARVAAPFAGAQRGMMFYPEIGDEVLVGFEDGDPAHAVIVGALWNGTEKPPLSQSNLHDNGTLKQRMIKTRAGHEILIEDTAGSEKIQIKDKIGAFVLLDSANKLIHLKDSAGNEVMLDGQGRSVIMKSVGAMTIEAAQALTIKGMSVTMQSTSGVVEVKAATNLVLIATANADLKANANVTVQGNAMVSVKSSAMLQIQGSLVKIN